VAIHQIDTEGNLTWKCPHVGEKDEPCGQEHQHHISHEAIQWHGMPGMKLEHHTVSLPPCSGCGAQTFLKVAFTERELKAPNMWLEWTSERAQALVDSQKAYQEAEDGTPHKAALVNQIQQLQAIRDSGGLHTESHAMAMRHVEMARQLKASGKNPPGQGE
jgi:hypothetical protein